MILMTAHYSAESAVEAIRKGASDYLNEPVSLGTLRERVGKLVEEGRKQLSFQLENELRTNSEFPRFNCCQLPPWHEYKLGRMPAGPPACAMLLCSGLRQPPHPHSGLRR